MASGISYPSLVGLSSPLHTEQCDENEEIFSSTEETVSASTAPIPSTTGSPMAQFYAPQHSSSHPAHVQHEKSVQSRPTSLPKSAVHHSGFGILRGPLALKRQKRMTSKKRQGRFRFSAEQKSIFQSFLIENNGRDKLTRLEKHKLRLATGVDEVKRVENWFARHRREKKEKGSCNTEASEKVYRLASGSGEKLGDSCGHSEELNEQTSSTSLWYSNTAPAGHSKTHRSTLRTREENDSCDTDTTNSNPRTLVESKPLNATQTTSRTSSMTAEVSGVQSCIPQHAVYVDNPHVISKHRASSWNNNTAELITPKRTSGFGNYHLSAQPSYEGPSSQGFTSTLPIRVAPGSATHRSAFQDYRQDYQTPLTWQNYETTDGCDLLFRNHFVFEELSILWTCPICCGKIVRNNCQTIDCQYMSRDLETCCQCWKLQAQDHLSEGHEIDMQKASELIELQCTGQAAN